MTLKLCDFCKESVEKREFDPKPIGWVSYRFERAVTVKTPEGRLANRMRRFISIDCCPRCSEKYPSRDVEREIAIAVLKGVLTK